MRPDRFGPPRLQASVVARPRLVEALGRRFDARVVTVEGAAGFGKTTLLAQAVAENAQRPVGIDVWLTCTPSDADAGHLGTALAHALGGDRAVGDATGIANLVWHRAPTPVALILDDVHLIRHASTGAGLLTALLTELPDNGHLVLSGRAPLPVSTTRLLVQGRHVIVDEEQLRLTDDELAAVADEHGLPGDSLAASAGWPALAGLAAAAGADAVRRFVLEEVYGALPPSSRESLAALCLLGGGDDATLQPALGRPVQLASELASVPLVAHHDRDWYVPHALWLPIVDGVLDDETARQIRRVAARSLHARGDLAGAAELVLTPTLDDEDWAVVRDLVADACQIGVWVHHGAALVSWLHRLAPDRRQEPAGLLLAAATERILRGDLAATEPFEHALLAARAADDVPVELAALSHLGHLAWWRDDLAAGAALCARADELAAAGWTQAEPIARFGSAMVAEIMGDPAAALRAASGVDRAALSDLLAAAADWLQARALIQLGRADEAIEYAQRACGRAEFPAARTALTIALYQSGQIAAALAAAAHLDPTAARSVRDRVLFGVVLASGSARLGRLEDARRAAAVAGAERDAVAGTRAAAMVELAHALIAVAEGDEATATRHAARAADPPDDPGTLFGLVPFLAATYVLVPETRPTWEAMSLGPDHRTALDAARRLIAVRGGAALGPGAPPPDRVIAALGVHWAIEVAAASGDDALADRCVRLAPAAVRARLHALADHEATSAGARALLRSVPTPPTSTTVVRLLGPATLERDGGAVDHPDWRRERVRSLLAYLVVRGRTTRGEVAATMWPDLDAEAASANLRVTLRYLHRVLEPERDSGAAPWYVRTTGDVLELATDRLVVDSRAMEAQLDIARDADRAGRTGDTLAALRGALAWWHGDFAVDVFDEWVDHERTRLRARFLAGVVRAGELLLGRGEVDEALELGTRALLAEEWSEPAYRLVASAHLARGDRASARRTLERCRAVLDDFGVGAEPQTEMLWRRLDPAAD